ncbi:hypothetical protein Ancab_018810 [Ancistrocladus abbreviatus]
MSIDELSSTLQAHEQCMNEKHTEKMIEQAFQSLSTNDEQASEVNQRNGGLMVDVEEEKGKKVTTTTIEDVGATIIILEVTTIKLKTRIDKHIEVRAMDEVDEEPGFAAITQYLPHARRQPICLRGACSINIPQICSPP